MSEALLLTLIQTVGAAIFGFLLARYTIQKQKSKKVIAYQTSQINLLKLHKDVPDSINITVNRSVISEEDSDSGSFEKIKNAVAHEIVFKNKGNSVASDIYVDIIFNEETKILSYSSDPEESDAFNLSIKKTTTNKLRLFLPYLNINQKVKLSIICTGEESFDVPSIIGNGKDIHIYKFERKTGIPLKLLMLFSILYFPFILILLFESKINLFSMGSLVPKEWVTLIGGEVKNIEIQVATFPFLVSSILVLLGIVALIVIINRMQASRRF